MSCQHPARGAARRGNCHRTNNFFTYHSSHFTIFSYLCPINKAKRPEHVKQRERTLKAYWCVCRDDDPPYIHDHERIAKGCGIYTKMSEEQKDFLEGIKRMNIEARYQEVKDAVARSLNSKNTARILETTKQLHAWILQKLQEKSTTL